MISVDGTPAIKQEWPIVRWDGETPVRSKELTLEMKLSVAYEEEDREVVAKFVEAYQELMKKAVSRKTGNPVIQAPAMLVSAKPK